MPRRYFRSCPSLLPLLFAAASLVDMVATLPASASQQAIGSVAASTNATVGGQQLIRGATLLSGDTLEVSNGATEIVLTDGSRLVFGLHTEASFLREGGTVTALLRQGNIVLYHAKGHLGLQVKISNLLIMPTTEFKTVGDIAIVNGDVVVTSKEGVLRVEGNGPPVDVSSGRPFIIPLETAHATQGPVAGATPAGTQSPKITTVTTLGLSSLGTVVSFVGLSRANGASAAADGAKATAAAAINSATSAANAAASAAAAAQAAINLANAVTLASLAEMNRVGCELDSLANSLGKASPYTPPPGFKCP